MNEFEKAKIILSEREGLRQEHLFYMNASHQCILAFVVAFAGALGTYFAQTPPLEKYRAALFLSLSQIEVLLFLLICTLLSAAQVNAGYIAGLEHKLNMLAKDSLNIWETKISPEYLLKVFNPTFMSYVLQGIGYTAIFVTLIYLSIELTNNVLWGAILIVEVLAIVTTLIWGLYQRKQVENFAKKELFNTVKLKQ